MLPPRLAGLGLLWWASRVCRADHNPYCSAFKNNLGSSPSVDTKSLPQGYLGNRIDTQDLTNSGVLVFTAGIFKETLKHLDIYSNFFVSVRSYIAIY